MFRLRGACGLLSINEGALLEGVADSGFGGSWSFFPGLARGLGFDSADGPVVALVKGDVVIFL